MNRPSNYAKSAARRILDELPPLLPYDQQQRLMAFAAIIEQEMQDELKARVRELEDTWCAVAKDQEASTK